MQNARATFPEGKQGRRPGTRQATALLAVLALLLHPAIARAQEAGQTPQTQQTPPGFTPLPAPSLNFYGSTGLIDMPTAEMSPDAQFSTSFSYFGGQTRSTLTFQGLPWLSASFRYNAIRNWNLGGFGTYYDRGFDLRFRLLREKRRWPGITLGLQDFVGTGIYAAEYIVATKQFTTPGRGAARLPGRLKATAGLGWGRLGSSGSIGAPFGADRPGFDPTGTGGQLAYDQWFRGPMAPFAGLEWLPNDRWGLKAEYSSDAYVTETQTTSVFRRKSRFNFGVEYQATPRTRIGTYYLYGSEIGVSAQIQLNPYQPPTPLRVAAPRPVQPRPDRASLPAAWNSGWAASRTVPAQLRDRLAPILRDQGLVLESLDVSATAAELRFRNLRYQSYANAVGRAARALSRVMPASVETFRLVPMSGGMALSQVSIRRSDLEALEFSPDAAAALEVLTGYGDAPPLGATAIAAADLYPDPSWSVAPYFSPSYFDPDRPFRIDVGVALRATYRPAPGWTLSGTIRQRIAGNVADSKRVSNSKLPPVRTNGVRYAQYGTTLNNMFAAYQWRPGKDIYGRATIGYLESMFGGISTELLWKPVSSRLGVGIEANWVRQRDFDQRLGFQDYSVATGYVSTYYDFGGGFNGQLDVGRYLAGDVGATFSLDREFDNGWLVGAFFTKTNVSAADFGEGSFDKGIRFQIPLSWLLGKPSRQSFGTTVRPIQRDGGARLIVPGRLYGQVRRAHRRALRAQNARFWE
jgi:Exopolysaccharide biosynthesis protein YbjH